MLGQGPGGEGDGELCGAGGMEKDPVRLLTPVRLQKLRGRSAAMVTRVQRHLPPPHC